MMTGFYILVALIVASLFGAVAWLASAGHSIRVQRTALIGAGCTATALLAPSPWALLPLAAAVAAFVRPRAVTHLGAAAATAVAFAGVLFLPGADAQSRRSTRSYAGSGKDRAYISGLKSDLRNVEVAIDVPFAERGRYDAILLASRTELLLSMSAGNELVLAPAIDRWHGWAHHSISDKACDIGTDQFPTCPVVVPVDSASAVSPRVFSPEWIRDSLPADHWSHHLPSLTSRAFGYDSVIAAEEIRLTVSDSGWVAERELAGWHCVTGARKLAPAGVLPGGIVCHILPVAWGSGADPHAP